MSDDVRRSLPNGGATQQAPSDDVRRSLPNGGATQQAPRDDVRRSSLNGGATRLLWPADLSVRDRERFARVDAQLKAFHGVGIAEVLEVVDYLREPGDTVIAGGSLAWGLGNRLSDFDVVVCGATTSPSRVPFEHWVGSLRIDAWTRSHAGLDKLFTHAANTLDSDAPLQGVFGSAEEEQQLKLLHRVSFGLRLAGPALPTGALSPSAPGMPAQHRAPTGRGHVDIARDLLVREYAERMRESVLVAQLAQRAGRALAATTNARLAVEECLHTVLAFRGVPFTGDKWLQERLNAVAGELKEHHARFAALPDDADAARFVEDAVGLCGQLMRRELSVEALSADLTWSVSGLQAHKAMGEHFLVAPAHAAVWELDAAEATTWQGVAQRGAGDRQDTDNPKQAQPSIISVSGDSCTADEAALLIRLYELGLASLDWKRGIPVSELEITQ